MSAETWANGVLATATARLSDGQADYRQRMAHLQAEALEHRQHELGEQCSPLKTPADRIRIWEHLHQVAMPASPKHRLIAVIAANTGLTEAEVLAEQRDRALPKAPDAPARP